MLPKQNLETGRNVVLDVVWMPVERQVAIWHSNYKIDFSFTVRTKDHSQTTIVVDVKHKRFVPKFHRR